MEQDNYYESAEDIVDAYYNGELEKTYPMLCEAIEIILKGLRPQK